MSREHDLKTTGPPFAALWDGMKTFELRRNDRNYRVGDTLLLREWRTNRAEFTGRWIRVVVTYMVQGNWGLERDFAALAIKELERSP